MGYENSRMNSLRHGHTGKGYESPTYRSWKAMNRRSGNANFSSYRDVGVDPRWRSFDAFLADMGERPAGTSLDRIDGEKDYCKANCRWADRYLQNQNKRDVVLTRAQARSVLGKKHDGASAKAVAKEFGCSACNVRDIWAGRAWGDLE